MTATATGVDLDLAVARVVGNVRALAASVMAREEREYCAADRRGDRYAGRLAAKRAVARLLDGGESSPVSLADIVIVRAADGRPRVRLAGDARSRAAANGFAPAGLDVSIAHRAGTAIAIAAARRPGAGASDVAVGVDILDDALVARSGVRSVTRLAGLVLNPDERRAEPYLRSPRATTVTAVMVKEAAAKVVKRDGAGLSWHDLTVVPLAGDLLAEDAAPAGLLRVAAELEIELGLERLSVGRVIAGEPWRRREVWAAWGHRNGFGYSAAFGEVRA